MRDMMRFNRLFNRILWALVALALSSGASAACRINPDILGAFYQIERQSGSSAAAERESLRLWRLHHEVAHERPERHYTDIWRRLSDGEVEHRRYNDQRQQQEPLQVRDNVLWPAKYQLLPGEALAKMQLLETSGGGCKRVEKYRLELASGRLTIWWNPVLQLVMLLDRQGTDVSTTMKLTAIEGSGPEVAKVFTVRREYSSSVTGEPQ